MLVKRGLKTKLVVYYEATMSMSTVTVFKFTHAFPWHMLSNRECYFPSGPDGHLAPSYAISHLGARVAASNCGRRRGKYTGWRGSENSRRGIVGEIISPLRLGTVRVRIIGRVRFRGLQMIHAKYDSLKHTGWFAQNNLRNSMDVSRKQASMLCFFPIKI